MVIDYNQITNTKSSNFVAQGYVSLPIMKWGYSCHANENLIQMIWCLPLTSGHHGWANDSFQNPLHRMALLGMIDTDLIVAWVHFFLNWKGNNYPSNIVLVTHSHFGSNFKSALFFLTSFNNASKRYYFGLSVRWKQFHVPRGFQEKKIKVKIRC